MTDEPSTQPRYWILKQTEELSLQQPELGEKEPKLWLAGVNSEVKPFDVIYFWADLHIPSFYGWGLVNSEPAPVPVRVNNVPSSRLGVRVSYQMFGDRLVKLAELRDHDILKSLSRLTEIPKSLIEMSNAEGAALNQLIRERGVATPPDPVGLPSEKLPDGDDGRREEPSGITLDVLLDSYSHRLSSLSRAILELAGQFANKREHNRDRVTSSCMLFAAVELGAQPPNREIETAAQFVFQWMNESELRSTKYKQAFSDFMSGADQERMLGPAILTSSTMKVIKTADGIANTVRTVTTRSEDALIHARDLVGALLFRMAKNSRMGATRRLADMDVGIEILRHAYFENFLVSINDLNNPDDDIEKWRTVLIDLTLPVEDRAAKVPSWTKASVPSIDADMPSLQDHLNIEAEVKGFANIIAARDVKTPLSIGVFGDWGSGKSTFMEQLQAEVNAISEAVRNKKQNEETSFLGNIVQIKFNAWHYAEANLWASLVSHVFENLSFSEKEEKEAAEKRKQLFLGQLVTGLAEQKAAEAEVKAKEVSYEEAKTALEGAKREQDDARLERIQWLTQGVWPLVREFLGTNAQAQQAVTDARNVLGKQGLTEEELKRELEASRTTLGQAQLHLTSLLEDPKRGIKIFAIIGLTIFVPLVLSFLVAWLTSSQAVKDVINGVMPVVTLLGGALAWWRSNRPTVDGWLQKFRDAENQLNAMYASAKSSYDNKLVELNRTVAAKEAEISQAQKRLDTAKTEVAQTVETLKEMEPGRVLERFVQERAASTDYRKLLGVIALIRRDFKKLSDMMREQDNQELRKAVAEILKKDEEQRKAAQAVASREQTVPILESESNAEPSKQTVEEALKEYRIDRIVLYIDDLDRCPPKQVVDVLQAIHLLLAFELFVVVVGVDARWVRHALRKRFPEMLSEDWDEGNAPKNGEERMAKTATPRDYVEKIFQVPFWLKPMDDDASKRLLEGLIPEKQLFPVIQTNGGKDKTSQTQSTMAKDRQSTGENGLDQSRLEVTGETNANQSEAKAGTTAITPTPTQEKSEDKVKEPELKLLVLKPENLLLDKKERDAMIALSRVIGRTPRTLKRFVNIYRIIKAGLNDDELEKFVGKGESDQYKAVLLLLSIAHGAPDIAPDFFIELKQEFEQNLRNKEQDTGFKTFVEKSKTRLNIRDISLAEAWTSLIVELEKAMKKEKDIPLAVLRKWLPVVVRYTFQLGRLSEQVANQNDRNKQAGIDQFA